MPFDLTEQEFMTKRFLGECFAVQRIGARRLRNAGNTFFPHDCVVQAGKSGHEI
jgi:hypothetical protein